MYHIHINIRYMYIMHIYKCTYLQSPEWLFSKHIPIPPSQRYFLCVSVCVIAHKRFPQSTYGTSQRTPAYLYLSFHLISIKFSCYSDYIFQQRARECIHSQWYNDIITVNYTWILKFVLRKHFTAYVNMMLSMYKVKSKVVEWETNTNKEPCMYILIQLPIIKI